MAREAAASQRCRVPPQSSECGWRRVVSRPQAVETLFVALAPFLAHDPRVLTLGVRPTLGDYSEQERRRLRRAACILFPTVRFADVLEAAGCRCVPSAATYRYQRWRPLQWTLAAFLNVPMAPFRLGYGGKGKKEISRRFCPPFRAFGPRADTDSIVLVESWGTWDAVAGSTNPIMVSDFVPYRWRDEVWVALGRVVAWRRVPWNGVAGPAVGPWMRRRDDPRCGPICERSLWVCRQAQIDEAVLCWGRADGSEEFFFEGIRRPPPSANRQGELIRRHQEIFSALLEDLDPSGGEAPRRFPTGEPP